MTNKFTNWTLWSEVSFDVLFTFQNALCWNLFGTQTVYIPKIVNITQYNYYKSLLLTDTLFSALFFFSPRLQTKRNVEFQPFQLINTQQRLARHSTHPSEAAYKGEEKQLTKKNNILRVLLPEDGCTSRRSEMNKSVTSGQVTVKRDLVVAPGRWGEAVCPLKALLQSQQPHANSLSRVCGRLCSACQCACSSTHTTLQAEAPWCTLVSLAHQIACLPYNGTAATLHICFIGKMLTGILFLKNFTMFCW